MGEEMLQEMMEAAAWFDQQKAAPKAVEVYMADCKSGDARSCNYLGLIYDTGDGVSRDEAKANEYYDFACALGYWASCAAQ
ncbi:MAG: SEL1-like repeat protein [Proteobacteria bacterium]|nr:SEL1-like repeat protein [Pseudomonadota bacterium]